ncbi:MAG: hypothetical protein SchgKO_12150 [Schleiferiaceae bacterium]
MKKTTYTFLAALMAGLSFSPNLYSQDLKPLDHSVYDSWNDLRSPNISESGKYVWFLLAEQKGNSEIHFYNSETKTETVYSLAKNGQLTHDEKFFVFQTTPEYWNMRTLKRRDTDELDLPKGSLVVVNLESNTTDTIPYVKSYDLPNEGSDWLVYETYEWEKTVEVPDTNLNDTIEMEDDIVKVEEMTIFRSLSDTNHLDLQKVDSYRLADKGMWAILKLKEKDSTQYEGIATLNSSDWTLNYIDTTREKYGKISIDKEGKQMAWTWTVDTSDADEKPYSLTLYTAKKTREIDAGSQYTGWTVSPFARPSFSDDGKALYFELREPQRVFEEDSLTPDNEKVKLDIWSHHDEDIMTVQLNNLSSDKEKGYTASMVTKSGKWVRLEDSTVTSVSYSRKFPKKYWTASGDRPYRKERSYAYPWRSDLYVVNAETGKATLVKEGSGGYQTMSPAGKYSVWYEPADTAWYAYDIKGYEIIELSSGIPNPIYNEDNDIPSHPYGYGNGGWTKKDKGIIIYDQYDAWLVDPKKPSSPKRLTSGRENKIRYRFTSMDPDVNYVELKNRWVSVFDKKTKTYNMGRYNAKSGKVEMVTELNGMVGRFDKAKNTEMYLYTYEDYNTYPDLYLLGTDGNSIKLSDANPQQAEFNWGTVELTEWKAYDGKMTEGLLYKPENFDPNKKYPMVVYFYETYSEQLHRHYKPQPQWSIINITYFVSNGYVVFVPDIHYTTGHPGKNAYDYIMSGTDHILSMGFVDEDKMGIQGQSWGGYQVAQLVTLTDRYACAMAGAPVSNMTSAYGGIRWGSGLSREFQYERTQSRLGTDMWTGLDLYLENSPVFGANKVTSPLLIMHNDNDGAVPWYQGIEYYMALRRNQKEVWMLNYNGEAHNLRKRHNRMDLTIRMSQFFDHYLLGSPAPEWMTKGRKATEKEKNNAY